MVPDPVANRVVPKYPFTEPKTSLLADPVASNPVVPPVAVIVPAPAEPSKPIEATAASSIVRAQLKRVPEILITFSHSGSN
jgi:hypothetical protein